MLFTIFTPTYNRAYRLPDLYQSLLEQTHKDFEWVIVDDCSSDDTYELVCSWLVAKELNITYYRQVKNGGKHRAINRGMALANGELFFIVDSDDYLPPTALATISAYWRQVAADPYCAGVAGLRMTPAGENIGTSFKPTYLDTNSVNLRYKYGVKGDKAEVFRTSVLKAYPFPEFKGENFVTEALVFNRIAQKYYLRWFNEATYICEYLEDGLSANIQAILAKAPQAERLYYKELACHKYVPWRMRLAAATYVLTGYIFGTKGKYFLRSLLGKIRQFRRA